MDKLTIRELAPYLPYDLNTNEGKLIGLTRWIGWCGVFKDTPGQRCVPTSVIKPLLLPLSSLTKEIEVNGERFVPKIKILELADGKMINKIDLRDIMYRLEYILEYPYWVINLLLSWHIDVFSLIPLNLAIDKTTINP